MSIAPLLIICTIASVICTAVLAAGHHVWTKNGWSEEWRPPFLGLVLIVMFVITMVPGLILLDNIYDAMERKTVTVIDLPERGSDTYQTWGRSFNEIDEHCLALNVYFEARGEEDVRGKYAVADVVMYRLMHADYPNTVCEVVQDGHYHEWNPDLPVKHMCQFSWWCDGKSDTPVNTTAFEEAISIARTVLNDASYEPSVEFSLFYHATSVSPSWSKKMYFVETIGNHSFYANERGHVVP